MTDLYIEQLLLYEGTKIGNRYNQVPHLTQDTNGKPAFREDIFEALHDDLGHQGRDRTMSLIKQRFFWPGMDTYIKNKVASCERCIRRKAGPDRGKLVNITSTTPMEIVCLDYLSSPAFHSNVRMAAVCVDSIFKAQRTILMTSLKSRTTPF